MQKYQCTVYSECHVEHPSVPSISTIVYKHPHGPLPLRYIVPTSWNVEKLQTSRGTNSAKQPTGIGLPRTRTVSKQRKYINKNKVEKVGRSQMGLHLITKTANLAQAGSANLIAKKQSIGLNGPRWSCLTNKTCSKTEIPRRAAQTR